LRSTGKNAAVAMLAAALLAAVLAVPAFAGAGEGAASAGSPAPPEKPQLLLIHGGGFLVDDPVFQPLTEPRAIAAGFEPHYLTYPLGNVRAAVRAARLEARQLRERYGADDVFAYGSSAGGTLTALLSGDGLVAAAVAKAPVSDLVEWRWGLEKYGSDYFSGLVGLSEAARYRLSPDRRPQKSPLLVVQGRDDNVVPPEMNETFASKYPRVHLWMVPGGHTTERYRPYLITKAMRWLATVADRRLRTTGQPEGRWQRCIQESNAGASSRTHSRPGDGPRPSSPSSPAPC
jgi:pimeloyl-ACP methyl ester carboxylesterase